MQTLATMTTVPSEYETMAENFALLPDQDERLRYLIQVGRKLPPIEQSEQVDENLVRGCQSSVWLLCDQKQEGSGDDAETTLHFRGLSDAQIVSGLVAIVLSRYTGLTPEGILSVDTDSILEGFGLQGQLSPGRRNGLSSMVGRIRQFAVEAIASDSDGGDKA